jgi:hypothetical protein
MKLCLLNPTNFEKTIAHAQPSWEHWRKIVVF